VSRPQLPAEAPDREDRQNFMDAVLRHGDDRDDWDAAGAQHRSPPQRIKRGVAQAVEPLSDGGRQRDERAHSGRPVGHRRNSFSHQQLAAPRQRFS
jgi:hypothetical protein